MLGPRRPGPQAQPRAEHPRNPATRSPRPAVLISSCMGAVECFLTRLVFSSRRTPGLFGDSVLLEAIPGMFIAVLTCRL